MDCINLDLGLKMVSDFDGLRMYKSQLFSLTGFKCNDLSDRLYLGVSMKLSVISICILMKMNSFVRC